jgi:hypothetical protein
LTIISKSFESVMRIPSSPLALSFLNLKSAPGNVKSLHNSFSFCLLLYLLPPSTGAQGIANMQ